MARTPPTQGVCTYCGQTFAKAGITRHLSGCAERRKTLEQKDSAAGKKETLFHLVIGDRWRSDYWLHLEMRGTARLEDLDDYLRAIWLECCGHMSGFSTGRFGDELPMSARADKIFAATESLVHYYDYGTTSETTVKVAGKRTGKPTTEHPIALMARNLAPPAVCIACGKPASHLCQECVYEDESEGTL